MSLGDMDGDGDLDILTSDSIYRNEGEGIFNDVTNGDYVNNNNSSWDVAWGDMDGDGDLDILATGSPNNVYQNDGGIFTEITAGDLATDDGALSLAWGDMDGDGYLDVLAGNSNRPNKVYRNEGNGIFVDITVGDLANDLAETHSVAWGDMDGDGDLDILVGNKDEANRIYNNNGAGIFSEVTKGDMLLDTYDTRRVAWGDIDGDGDLDILVGNSSEQPNRVYRNDGNGYFVDITSGDLANNSADTHSITWGDVDGDGDLDILTGNSSINGGAINRVYRNDEGEFNDVTLGDLSQDIYRTHAVALGDMNGDGDLDVVVVNSSAGVYHPNKIYENANQNNTFYLANNPHTIEIPEIENIPIVERFGVGTIITSRYVSLTTTINDPEQTSIGSIEVWYSLNGGGNWKPATLVNDFSTSPITANIPITIVWDTFTSGIFGQSDNVSLRFEANIQGDGYDFGEFSYPNHTPHYTLYGSPSVTSLPFRVRGTQVQVYSETVGIGNEVAGAQVMRLPVGQTSGAFFMSDAFGQPYQTNGEGYLQGFGELGLGDKLVALVPVLETDAYTVYHTSYTRDELSLGMHEVMTPGVQALTVSADNPLVVFHTDVSLEWDARGDEAFLNDLDIAFRRASEVLFDVSNGQVALGDVRVHHNRENWVASDIVIHASGSIRPKASMGGIATDLITDTNRFGDPIPAAYGPGQVSMGTVWDPFGENTAELTEDWWLALSHELAHYLLYLPDNYLGINEETGAFYTIDCAGSFMTSTYDDTYSELLNEDEWADDPVCVNDTFAANTTGRYDWATVTNFYPMLFEPTVRNEGPVILPLDLINLTPISPTLGLSTTLPILSRNVDLRDAVTGDLLTLPYAQAYLIQDNDPADPEDNALLPLGQPNGDYIKVRGAKPNDTLCIFAPYQADLNGAYQGCAPYQETTTALMLDVVPNWQPNIKVTAPNEDTFEITVTLTSPISDLNAQLIPAYSSHEVPLSPIVSPIISMTPVDSSNLIYLATVASPYPLFEGHIYIYDNADIHQAVLPFYLNPPWGPMNRPIDMGPNMRGWGANQRAFNAPVSSGDGAVTIYNQGDIFGETGTFSLQALSNLPNLSNWLTPVGQGYRFVASDTGSTVINRTIAFDYLQRDVPPGYEFTLFIVYSPDEGATWEQLVTNLDTDDNLASSPMPLDNDGQGLYAVVSSLALPQLEPGWNLIVNPFNHATLVTETLASIAEDYTVIYAPDSEALYDNTVVKNHPEFAPLVNDLAWLNPFGAYEIYATDYVTPFVSLEPPRLSLNSFVPAPAGYYGYITPTIDFTPTVGMVVTAWVDGTLCGQTTVVDTVGTSQLTYAIRVKADTGDGCGNMGEPVSFMVSDTLMAYTVAWDNAQATYLPLSDASLLPGELFNNNEMIYISTGGTTYVDGIRIQPEDIMGYDTRFDVWYRIFDGSDVGLSGANIDAFTVLEDGRILLSISVAITHVDLGSVEDVDILEFTPTSMGRVTAGSFQFFFRGADHDLSPNSEDIKALDYIEDEGLLLISTAKTANVPDVSAKDEDILAFDRNSETWSLFFDGSAVGLETIPEDIRGIRFDTATNKLFLTVEGLFSIGNVNGDGLDIIACTLLASDETTNCLFDFSLWDGTEWRLEGVIIDAIFR